ncbi:transposase [Methylobacterium sp. Leaf399]|uniref:ISAs1 family transposase n=1 Tax=Methylobacterium sp. Leaf399 TaxID=1736364 RepID=UPI0006FE9489|nr:ISAs1 family transposase [Methylobacterium sp. Leaf399]KQT07326.1 transposase [Methylobacterium sp. Leaf399]
MRSLITILGTIPDPRTGNAQRHELLDVLTIALVASICGCQTCVDMADFAEDREALFREFLRLEHGLPSHDTFSRLFRLLDPHALCSAFGHFLDVLGSEGSGGVAIDGKTLRRSFDRAVGTSALHVVTAFAADAKLVIGQKAVAAGSNEIVAGRALLELLSLNGALVTADAIHCQSETARTVLARGGDYLFALKGNRPALHADVKAFFADPPADSLAWHETSDADHGRIEIRRHAVTHSVDWLFSDRRYAGEPAMPGLASLAMVTNTVERDGQTTTATRYYLSSASLTPERFASAVRAHWHIENSLHWVLDTAFDEDRARTRKDHGPENLAILRKLALNVLKQARPGLSIRRKRNRAGWSDAFARTIIAQMR